MYISDTGTVRNTWTTFFNLKNEAISDNKSTCNLDFQPFSSNIIQICNTLKKDITNKYRIVIFVMDVLGDRYHIKAFIMGRRYLLLIIHGGGEWMHDMVATVYIKGRIARPTCTWKRGRWGTPGASFSCCRRNSWTTRCSLLHRRGQSSGLGCNWKWNVILQWVLDGAKFIKWYFWFLCFFLYQADTFLNIMFW